jgi:hypothetical protein
MAIKPDAASLVALLFLARDAAHKEHLSAGSYSRHVALQEFYDAITPLADDFAEAYQGCDGKLLDIPVFCMEYTGPLDFIDKHIKWINTNRSKISSESFLQNIIDEILQTYAKARYKLMFLK